MKRVLMTDELFDVLGASKVEWGEPDAEGFYSPTVYADTTEATLRAAYDRARDVGRKYKPSGLYDALMDEAVRAALQQRAVQPEGTE